LKELADILRADGTLLSETVVDYGGPTPHGDAAGERLKLVVEAIREGYLQHYASGRVVRPDDPDLALLAGDRLYALGLERLAAIGDLDAVAELAEKLPACRVVMVTTFGRPGYLQRAMAAGAVGFLVKDGPVEGLADAIRRVAAGATVVDPELAGQALRAAANPLTSREGDVLAAAEDGASIADIADRLHLSASTVRNYLSDAIGKTGTRNKTEAAILARRNGWL